MPTRSTELVRAVKLLSLGEHSLAERTAGIGLRLHPNDGALHQVRGIARHHLRRYAECLDDFNEAEVLSPLSSMALWCRADALRRVGRTRDAIEQYSWLLSRKEVPASLLARTAAGLGRMGEDDRALTACEQLMADYPEMAEGFVGSVFFMSRLGYSAKAMLPRMVRACELAPTNTEYRAHLGFLKAGIGEGEGARTILADLPHEQVGCPHLATRIARTLEDSGDIVSATAWWRRAIRLVGATSLS